MEKLSNYLVYYDDYQEVYTRPPGYFDSLVNEIVKFLPKEKDIRILDIGCGFGDFLASSHKKLGPRAQYFGLTIAKHEFESIFKNRPFIKVKLGKEQDLSRIFPGPNRFDMIINFQTLSYIPQKLQSGVVRQIISNLNDGGLLVLGLIDDWIKISSRVNQGGEGFVQFYYSPWMFLPLDQNCSLISSIKFDDYRIQFWKKAKNKKISIKGPVLSLGYIIRNNLLFLNIFSKVNKKIKRKINNPKI